MVRRILALSILILVSYYSFGQRRIIPSEQIQLGVDSSYILLTDEDNKLQFVALDSAVWAALGDSLTYILGDSTFSDGGQIRLPHFRLELEDDNSISEWSGGSDRQLNFEGHLINIINTGWTTSGGKPLYNVRFAVDTSGLINVLSNDTTFIENIFNNSIHSDTLWVYDSLGVAIDSTVISTTKGAKLRTKTPSGVVEWSKNTNRFLEFDNTGLLTIYSSWETTTNPQYDGKYVMTFGVSEDSVQALVLGDTTFVNALTDSILLRVDSVEFDGVVTDAYLTGSTLHLERSNELSTLTVPFDSTFFNNVLGNTSIVNLFRDSIAAHINQNFITNLLSDTTFIQEFRDSVANHIDSNFVVNLFNNPTLTQIFIDSIYAGVDTTLAANIFNTYLGDTIHYDTMIVENGLNDSTLIELIYNNYFDLAKAIVPYEAEEVNSTLFPPGESSKGTKIHWGLNKDRYSKLSFENSLYSKSADVSSEYHEYRIYDSDSGTYDTIGFNYTKVNWPIGIHYSDLVDSLQVTYAPEIWENTDSIYAQYPWGAELITRGDTIDVAGADTLYAQYPELVDMLVTGDTLDLTGLTTVYANEGLYKSGDTIQLGATIFDVNAFSADRKITTTDHSLVLYDGGAGDGNSYGFMPTTTFPLVIHNATVKGNNAGLLFYSNQSGAEFYSTIIQKAGWIEVYDSIRVRVSVRDKDFDFFYDGWINFPDASTLTASPSDNDGGLLRYSETDSLFYYWNKEEWVPFISGNNTIFLNDVTVDGDEVTFDRVGAVDIVTTIGRINESWNYSASAQDEIDQKTTINISSLSLPPQNEYMLIRNGRIRQYGVDYSISGGLLTLVASDYLREGEHIEIKF